MSEPLLWMAGGLVLLYLGAEGLVKGASRLALRCGLTPLAVGLTIVAYGTSSPEMIVSLDAALAGQADIAVGNIVGSNIFNIAFILGLCALITPIRADAQIIRREIPIMIGVSVLLLGVLWDRTISRWEGALLLAGAIGYTVYTLRAARRSPDPQLAAEAQAELPRPAGGLGRQIAFIVGGLLLLVAGGHTFVTGAVQLARLIGLSEVVIGLTIIAGGTSLPELATSFVAALKKQAEISVGNIVGSNIFNILGILGVCALIRPLSAGGITTVDLGVMLVVAVALLPMMRSGQSLSRWEAAVL
ncbi:MAG: calcium/sodium antiporter, partial [Limisphaerales bacterium]